MRSIINHRILFFLFLFFGVFLQVKSQVVRYVSTSGTTTSGDASNATSWNTACYDLQAVINVSNSGDSIFVAAGIYKPTHSAKNWTDSSPTDTNSNLTDRDNAFVLRSGIKIFGGFAGTENSISERIFDENNPSVLSGDINNDGTTIGNAYHVIISSNNDNNTVLDGFTIVEGYANGTSDISVCNNTIIKNSGAGIINYKSEAIFQNLKITNNSSVILAEKAVAIANLFSQNKFINCLISGNHGGSSTIYNSESSPIIINLTISGNQSNGMASLAIANVNNSVLEVYNSVIWSEFLNEIYNDASSSTTCMYSLVKNMDLTATNGLDGNNTNNDPLFINPTSASQAPTSAGNYKLQSNSPCINKGNNSYNNLPTDIANNQRINACTIDIGTYETTLILPKISMAASDFRCFGDSIQLFTFEGMPPFSVTYFNGVKNQTISNILSTKYYFKPQYADTTYTFDLRSVEDACNSVAATGISTFHIDPLPTITMTPPQTINVGDNIALFSLTGNSPWIVEFSDTTFYGIQSNTYYFQGEKTGIYTFQVNAVSDLYCSSNENKLTIITVQDTSLLNFDKYVIAKWNNIFILNLKLLKEEGIVPNACKWYKNNELLCENFSYSAGNKQSDILEDDAVYKFELITNKGSIFSTEKLYNFHYKKSFTIYPNPTAGQLTILNSQLSTLNCEIYDVIGNKVSQFLIDNCEFLIELSVFDFPAGVYFIKINDDVQQFIKK